MKCPNCKTDGAYEPLLRPIECVNAKCKLYVKPKVFYAIHSVDIKKPKEPVKVFYGPPGQEREMKQSDATYEYTSLDPKAIGVRPKPIDIKKDIAKCKKYFDEILGHPFHGQNPCGEVPLGTGGPVVSSWPTRDRKLIADDTFRREYEANWDSPVEPKEPVSLDSMKIMDVRTETDTFSRRTTLDIRLVGNFRTVREANEVRQKIAELLAPPKRPPTGYMSHGYGILDSKRILTAKF